MAIFQKDEATYETIRFNNEGFTISVETLHNDHITLFEEKIKNSYAIEVDRTQIVQLVLSKFDCKITLADGKRKYLLVGEAHQLNVSPLEVFFYAPIASKERNAFEQQLGIIDEIFGPASEVFVTRNQLSELATEIYSKLNILEEYEMPESEFDSSFVNDLIKQTANSLEQR